MAEQAFRKLLELNPQYPGASMFLGRLYLSQSKLEAATAEMQKEQDPVRRLYGLTLAYHAAGEKNQSDAALSKLIEQYQKRATFQIAEIYGYRGEADKAFDWLERAYQQHDGGLISIKGNPLLRSLEHDARWRALLNKMRPPTG